MGAPASCLHLNTGSAGSVGASFRENDLAFGRATINAELRCRQEFYCEPMYRDSATFVAKGDTIARQHVGWPDLLGTLINKLGLVSVLLVVSRGTPSVAPDQLE